MKTKVYETITDEKRAQIQRMLTSNFNTNLKVEVSATYEGYVVRFYRIEDRCEPSAGIEKYFVTFNKLNVFTAMGADNRHHAANKATKLWGPNWTSIGKQQPETMEFVGVKEFGELIKATS